MHLNFDWTTAQVLWTVTFAALLVLLVVLLGRDLYKRFKWFTISIVLVTFRLLASRLLYGKMAPLGFYELFIPLADLTAIVSVLVLVELARRSFVGLQRRAWIVGTLVVVAVGAGVVSVWGPWPAWKTLTAGSTLAVLGLMQLASQKTELLVNVMTAELGLLVLLFGRRHTAGWRSHAQGILIGLSTVSIAQMLRDGIWELIALKAVPRTQAEYDHLVALREKLFNASEVVFLAAVVWWIACLWMDEPGTAAPADLVAKGIPVVELEAPIAVDDSSEITEERKEL
ncbi:MAG: hypothetical protein WBQ94_01210 [Terracidiphilus sp.]